jgi:hypothetical protein
LLVAVAEGHKYADLAATNGSSGGALRAKVFRPCRDIA